MTERESAIQIIEHALASSYAYFEQTAEANARVAGTRPRYSPLMSLLHEAREQLKTLGGPDE